MRAAYLLMFTAALAACGDNLEQHQDVTHSPSIGDLAVTTAEDAPLTFDVHATDLDGDPLALTVTTPLHGTLTSTGLSVTYTPDVDFHGNDRVTVSVSDGTHSASATVTITVTPVNDAPTAIDDAITATAGTAATIATSALLANDSDLDGDPLAITSVGAASSGTVSLAGTTITYTPATGFTGTATFTYTVSDGTLTDTATVTVTIGNHPPVAVDDAVTTPEDTAATILAATLAGNDTDADGQALSVTAVANPTNGTVVLSGTTITFTPTANFAGGAGFDYTVSDGVATDTGHVTVTVSAVNDPPTATPSSVQTNEDSAVQLTLTGSDPEGSALTFAIATPPAHGTLGAITQLSPTSARVTYTPAPDSAVDDTFTFVANDGSLDSAAATASIDVLPINDPPAAVMTGLQTLEDTAVQFTLTGIDVEADPLTFAIASGPTHGTLGAIIQVTPTTAHVTYTPAPNSTLDDSFTFTVNDGAATSAAALATIDVVPVNDLPTVLDDAASVAQDAAAAPIDVLGNDSDIEGPLTVTSVGTASHGTASLAAGIVSYAPAAGYSGTDAFTYTVTDSDGATATANVNVTIASGNTPPTATPQTVAVREGAATTIVLAGTDPDLPAQTLTFAIGAAPTSGTLGAVTPTSATTATVTYTPNAGFAGADAFTFTVNDGFTTSSAATVAITVRDCGDGVTEAPETCDDNGTTDGDGCAAGCLVETGWSCSGTPSLCAPVCNDGLLLPGEACDDGNASDTDGCTTLCQVGPVCATTNALLATADHFATAPATATCYAAFDDEVTTFAAAQAACIAAGGHLATITSAGEQALVSSVQNPAQNPWIGGTDAAVEGTFTWLTGEAFAFTSFAPGEPDNGGGVTEQDCLDLTTGGAWSDVACDDASVVGRVCEVAADVCGDGFVQTSRSEQCDDGNHTPHDGCSATCRTESVFFSEYVEGSSNNKALEIANPSTSPVNLTGCSLRLYSNGASTPGATFPLTQTIAGSDVLVLCNASSNAALLPLCDVTVPTTPVATAVLSFNGDDAVELICNGVSTDTIGQIGFRPTTEWGTGLTSTADNTLRRKCTAGADGNGTNVFDPAVEWDGFATDTFGGLGTRGCP